MKKIDLNLIDWAKIQDEHNKGLYFYYIPKKFNISVKILLRALDEGLIIKKIHKRHHSEETKKIMSEKKKKFLKDNPDKHPWKNHEKFKSVPCEKFKDMLRENGISFLPEYPPLEDRHYAVDVAFPDKKIAIEINGNQHYNKDGSLKPYYQEKHDNIESVGWKVFEIHFSLVYNSELIANVIKKIKTDFNLGLIDYSGYKIKEKRVRKYGTTNDYAKARIRINEEKMKIKYKDKIENLIKLDIDFSKFGWTKRASEFIGIKSSKVSAWMKKYLPDFYEQKCFKKSYEKKFCSCGKEIKKVSIRCDKCTKLLITKRPPKEQLKKDLEGLKTNEICEKYNVNRQAIYKWKKKYDLM